MWFLSRPPWLRWAAASAVVVAAFAWDLSARSTEPYPFAAADIRAGTNIDDALIEWRPVPSGSLAPPDLDRLDALVDIRAGDPITQSVAGQIRAMPSDWWAVPIRMPSHLIAGTEVRLVLPDGSSIDALVSAEAVVDEFGGESVGAVAVAEEYADIVAAASAANAVVVLARP